MKSKDIAIEISYSEAESIRQAGGTAFSWVRPNRKFKSAMNVSGGFSSSEPFANSFETFVYGGPTGSGGCCHINDDPVYKNCKNGNHFGYAHNTNFSFFKFNPCQFDKNFFEMTGFNVLYLRKYTTEQKEWVSRIIKTLFKKQNVVVGEFYPYRLLEGVVHIYLSDTYCYFSVGGMIKEIDPTTLINAKTFKPGKAKKFTKVDILKAMNHMSDIISEREVTDKQFQHKDAQTKWQGRKKQIQTYATEYKKARHKEVAIAKAEQAARAVLTPEEMKYLISIHKESSQNTRAYKVEVDKEMFEYKRYLNLAKSPVPTKKEYEINEKQMNKEFTKIIKFLDDGTIEKFDYDPAKGIIITFPPMAYKSFRGGTHAKLFLGRPRVVIHDPSVCSKGRGVCGIIRFTLPSYIRGHGATDHFDNSNGTDMLDCARSGSRDGQCLGTSTAESFLQIFMPLISSRRFGELIPHLKRYILESNGNSPMHTPPGNMVFTGTNPGDRHPTDLLDDSWTEYCKKEIAKKEPITA